MKHIRKGATEKALRLRTLAVFPENLGLIPSIYIHSGS